MRGGRQLPWFPLHLEAAAKPNAGAGGGESAADDDAREARIVAQLERMLSEKGKEADTARKLFDDNARIRRKYQRVRTERDEAQAKVPAEGAVVLTGEDAKAFPDIQKKLAAAGLTLDKLGAALDAGATAQSELVGLKRKDVAGQAGELLGWDTDVLLDRLDNGPQGKQHLELVTTTEKVDGKDVVTRVAKIRPADKADAALVELNDSYLEQHWPKFRGALVKGDAPAGAPSPRSSTPPRPAPTTRSGDTRIPPTADLDQLAKDAKATGLYAAF